MNEGSWRRAGPASGFGVGQEPLVALFADAGCDLVATDQPHGAAVASGWTDSEVEWAGGLEHLNTHGLCPDELFVRRVRFRPVDMNAIPADLRGFDFTWSSCALEHLGTLGAGADFVMAPMECLRPGGVAVHTTEYLVASNDETVEAGGTVFYRRRDIEALADRLRRAGHAIDVDFTLGATPEDLHVDVPPYTDVHLRTRLGDYETTSLALVITKGSGRRRGRAAHAAGPQVGAMGTDGQGLTLTGSTEATVHYDRAVDHLVRFQIEVVEAQASARAADPRCAMAGVFGAYLSLMSTEAASVADARDALAGIAGDAGDLAPREQAHLAAAGQWVAGDMAGAGAILADVSLRWPRDLLALFVGHQIDFFTGDAVSLRDRIGRALWAWTPDDPRFGFVQGMYAFGLEECNLYGLSEDVAQGAVATNPDDVWGIHAMVHTYEMQGRIAEGVAFMRDRERTGPRGTSSTSTTRGTTRSTCFRGATWPGALAIYDRVLHHDGSEDVALELVDASSLLWRLHLEGEAVGDRWRSLAQAWGRQLTPGYYPFNDVHAAMAFIGAGDLERARELVADLEAVVEKGDRETTGWVMTSTVGLPVCRSLVAFGNGDYARVIDELWPVRTRLHEFGGSHAQRDAVERTLLEAAIRAKRSEVARALGERAPRREGMRAPTRGRRAPRCWPPRATSPGPRRPPSGPECSPTRSWPLDSGPWRGRRAQGAGGATWCSRRPFSRLWMPFVFS